ncbi:hypothetical protein ACFSX9_15335 [Flavobacterium ardleyense]|uniref:DUF4178 domain containing protein n=1 Tax=Flavobacterium ardleyense TaxID=2038737 RepID=A0ABW5ZBF0_9FLAO
MYWIGSQENPQSFSINDVSKVNDFSAVATVYLNHGGPEEAFATITLEKDKTYWKITDIKFLSKSNIVEEKSTAAVKWENSLVTLIVDNDYLIFKYHEQCIYFYPIKKISATEFEMIWGQEMDCKFDNGTGNDFNLKNVPETGKSFAKFELTNNILHAKYYYRDWVEAFGEKVNNEVFTLEYHRKKEDLGNY